MFYMNVYAFWKTLVNTQPVCQKGKINLHIKTDMSIFIGLCKKSPLLLKPIKLVLRANYQI